MHWKSRHVENACMHKGALVKLKEADPNKHDGRHCLAGPTGQAAQQRALTRAQE